MTVCKRCGREVEHVSKKGLCIDCGMGAVQEAAKQMQEKKGPIYEKQRARIQEIKQHAKLVE
jgi:ribosomal protein L37E